MKDGHDTDAAEVRAAAEAYARALHEADAGALDALCDPAFCMTTRRADGTAMTWDRATFLARVGGRAAFDGAPSFGIEAVEVTGGEIAHVRLWVDVPPRRFEDHLGFVRAAGNWKLTTKLFRTASGPALEG